MVHDTRDLERLTRAGFVDRALPAGEARRWRHALTGQAHAYGLHVLTGYAAGRAWAAVNDAPVEPGRALHPPGTLTNRGTIEL